MDTPTKTTNIPAVSALDEVLGNVTVDGIERTRRQTVGSLAAQLAGTETLRPIQPIYATVSNAASELIGANVKAVQILGRVQAGDTSVSVWARVASEPNVPDAEKLRSADRFLPSGASDATNGGWWQIKTTLPRVDLFTGVWTAQSCIDYLQARMAAGLTVKLIAYGDSTTDGYNTTGWSANPVDGSGNAVGSGDHAADAPNAWPAVMQYVLREMHGNSSISVYNAGYFGKELADGWAYDNYEAAIIDNPAYGAGDGVLIKFGLNDVTDPAFLATHISETRRLVQKIMAYGSIPILVGADATSWTLNRDNRTVYRQLEAAKRALASEMQIPYIEVAEAQKLWLGRNNDGYQWRQVQGDGLHFGDTGHRFIGCFLAKEFFADTVHFSRSEFRRVPSFDSAASVVISSLATTTNQYQGSTPIWALADVGDNEVLSDLWIWSEEPEAELIYRGIGHENFTEAGLTNAPRVTLWRGITDEYLVRKPAGVGFNQGSSPYFRSDLPYRVEKLCYGLNRVRYFSRTSASSGQWLGSFEIWKTGQSLRTDALKECGPVRVDFSVAPPSSLWLIPELPDGSNVYGLMDADAVDIYADLTLPVGAGLVIAHSSGYGSSGFGTKAFTFVYRSATFLTIYEGVQLTDGTITFAGTYVAQGAFAPGSDAIKLKCSIWRDGDNQRILVKDAFTGGTSVIDATVARTSYPAHFAGAVGGLFWNNTSAGGFAEIKDLTLVRR